MTLHIPERAVSKLFPGGMEDATAQRKQAKRAFLKVAKASLAASSPQLSEKVISARQFEDDWHNCAPLQREYLDATFRVFQLAALGNLIADNSEKCRKANKSVNEDDICQEVDQIFFHVVSKPTRKLRQCLDNPTITTRKRQWAHNMLVKVLSYPMLTFFKVADTLGLAMMRHIDEDKPLVRLRGGFLHLLMYISDCYRYLLEYKRSKDAVELMRILAPGDAEAHMRVAINLAMLSEAAQEFSPFFHYCAFLGNRNVAASHSEADVVSRYVQNVRAGIRSEARKNCEVHWRFTGLFIDVLWSILSDDFDSACEKAKRDELWNSLEQYLSNGVSQRDVLLMIGCLIFVHYRISPQGNNEGKTLLQSDLTEMVVCKVIASLAAAVCSCLRKLNQTIRGRKKNRRRAMQKKRRLDGSSIAGIPAEIVGYEVLRSIADVDAHVPYLGGLTSLAHYWSKSRMAPSPNSDFKGMADALKNLYGVVEELCKVEQITCTTSLTGLITSKIIADKTLSLPATSEDVMFCNYSPCRKHSMFRNVLIQQVPLPSILRGDRCGLTKNALRNMGDSTFESVVTEPVRRHMDAFGQQCIKELKLQYPMEKESSAALVILTLRKYRIKRLILGLEKVGGGKLSRMIAAGQIKCISDDGLQDQDDGDELPLAGQPVEEEHPEQDSFQNDLTSRELGSRLRKRRRLIGTSTPADVRYDVVESNSNESSRLHEETRKDLGSEIGQGRELPCTKRMKTKTAAVRKETEKSCGINNTTTRRTTPPVGRLSQGSFQLTFTPPVSSCGHRNAKSQEKQVDASAELSRILREVLYPSNEQVPSPPKNLTGPAFWRNCPSDDYVATVRVSNVASL